MNLSVTIGTKTIPCEAVLHYSAIIKGVQRPAIEFTFPDGAIKLDALRTLATDESKTQTIKVVNNDPLEDGTKATEVLTGYTIPTENCIQLRTVEVEPPTYEHPAVYADKIVLQLGLKFGWNQ